MNNLTQDLKNIFNNIVLKQFIDAIHHDRVTHADTTTALLKQSLPREFEGKPTVVDGKANIELIETHPLLYLLQSIANGEDNLIERERAAISYKKQYRDDNRFEFSYAYFNSPLPMLTHLLIAAQIWDKALGNNDKNVSYDSEMMGTLLGSISYKPGAKISSEHYQYLKQVKNNLDAEGKIQQDDGSFIFSNTVFGLGLKVDLAEWLDRMYIPSRRHQQHEVMTNFENKLKSTSKKLECFFNSDEKCVAFVIGPIASGKSTYGETVLGFQESTGETVILSADSLKGLMHTLDFLKPADKYQFNNSDLHFESCALSKLILPRKDEFKNLLITGAYIDDRFEQALGWYKGRNILVIEIAPLTPLQAAKQAFYRDSHWQKEDNFNYVINSANTAQQNRQARIDAATTQGFHYQLICNKPTQEKIPNFIPVVEINHKQIDVKDGILLQGLIAPEVVCSKERAASTFNELSSSIRVADLQAVGLNRAPVPEKSSIEIVEVQDASKNSSIEERSSSHTI